MAIAATNNDTHYETMVRKTPEVYPDLQEVKDMLIRKIQLLEEEVSNLYYRVEDLERGR